VSRTADALAFAREFARSPWEVASLVPSSPPVCRALTLAVRETGDPVVVELGAGTGVQTGEVLARLHPNARLVALEIDPDLAKLLEERYDDPRLQVVCDSAENLDVHLGGKRADVLVSALPYTSFEAGLRRRVLDLLPVALAPDGVLLVIQYSPLILRELRRRFPSVRQTITPWNVPPAFLYACRADPS